MSSNRHNPFDDDDDDMAFGNRNNQARSNYSRDDSDELKRLQMQIGQVENESLNSTTRALRAISEAQETGAKTAQELVRQGEQLNNINEKLDDVNSTLTHTQKNINQIKSIFGGLKNRFMPSSKSSDKLDKQVRPEKIPKDKSKNTSAFNETEGQGSFATITGSDREKEINKNLDEMSLGLKSLNSLANDMKRELDRQNPLIENITRKAEVTHQRIDDQDKQMKRIK